MKSNKIKSQKEIVNLRKIFKIKKRKVVTFTGSFDLLHWGHIVSLKEAKAQGDVFIVLLNSDKSVRSYKGPNRPIISEKDRAESLAALECVNYVVLFDEINPKKILSQIKPDIHCIGPDYSIKNYVAKKEVLEAGGKIHQLKKVPGLSSSNLIKKIIGIYSKPDVRAVFLDEGGTISVSNKPGAFYNVKELNFLPSVIPALKKLSKTDYKIFVVTNKSGVARGYFTEAELKKYNQRLLKFFKGKKIKIDKMYYCSHAPEDNCLCRKPGSGMLEKAAKEYGINLSKSFIVGDSESDVIAGKRANLKTTIMLKGKYFKKPEVEPDFYAKNILEAVNIILKKD